MPQFRTQDQLDQAKWAEKYLKVGNGTQYTTENSPLTKPDYINKPLLTLGMKLIEVNAGATVVDTFVADTMTDMTVIVGDSGAQDKKSEQEIWDWWNSIDYVIRLEEAIRNYFSAGFGLQQPIFRDGDVFASNVDPSRWYPKLPVFDWQSVIQGKVITPFYEVNDRGMKQWYAFVEEHVIGRIDYKLYRIEHSDALEGKEIGLNSLERFEGLNKTAQTQLETFDIIQVDRTKNNESLFGQSILKNVWDLLQEVNETQTQLRFERGKHMNARVYASPQSLAIAENVPKPATTLDEKLKNKPKPSGRYYDMAQEIFLVQPGGVIPGYIQRGLQSMTIGLAHIDDCLSKIAFTVGCPKTIFNPDQRGGDIKVDTEKRKDRKYVRQVLLAQRRASSLAVQMIETWWRWTKSGEPPKINVTFANPFGLSQEEITDHMRKQNRDAVFVSAKEARKQIWPQKTPEELEQMEKEIEEEEPDPTDFSKPPVVTL